LEFIGDAVLNCVIAEALFERFPASSEGELSRVRASLVNRDTLARLARNISLASEILLGDGESRSGGAERPSILADALEAVFGAVFLDGGYDATRASILRIYAPVWQDLDPAALAKDAKTRLQEWLQARRIPVPEYVVTELAGLIDEIIPPALAYSPYADAPVVISVVAPSRAICEMVPSGDIPSLQAP